MADLAHTCPYWRTNPRTYDPRCGARFEDLDRLRQQDLPPMLPDWDAPMLTVAFDECGRREIVEEKTLRAATVGDVRLSDRRQSLTAGRPRVARQDVPDGRGARLEAG